MRFTPLRICRRLLLAWMGLKLSRRTIFGCEKCILNKMQPCNNYSPTNTQALNQKSALMILFALLNAFQNDMTWPGSTKNHGGDRFQRKGLDAGQGPPHRDWADVLPTLTFFNSHLVTPEKLFNSYHPFKVIHGFLSHGWTDRQLDTQTPYKTNHLTTLHGQ